MLIKDYVAISIIHHSAVFVFNLLLLDQNLCCLAMCTTAKSINMRKNGLHGDNFREGIFVSEREIIIDKSLRKAFHLFFMNCRCFLVMNHHTATGHNTKTKCLILYRSSFCQNISDALWDPLHKRPLKMSCGIWHKDISTLVSNSKLRYFRMQNLGFEHALMPS